MTGVDPSTSWSGSGIPLWNRTMSQLLSGYIDAPNKPTSQRVLTLKRAKVWTLEITRVALEVVFVAAFVGQMRYGFAGIGWEGKADVRTPRLHVHSRGLAFVAAVVDQLGRASQSVTGDAFASVMTTKPAESLACF